MRVAVYPGSFDPLHIGHLAILRHLCDSCAFDEVYLVISPQNPFKEPGRARTAEQRYLAAVDAVRRHPELHVRVDRIELEMPAPTYTIRTLDALREREPDNDFTLVIGADNLQDIHRWRDADRILGEYGLAVYPRSGYDREALRETLLARFRCRGIRLIEAPAIDISSSRIRAMQEEGLDVSAWLM